VVAQVILDIFKIIKYEIEKYVDNCGGGLVDHNRGKGRT
jgi:hypothetical protein